MILAIRFLERRGAILACGWFLITLFPVMNLIPSGVLVAERSLYTPLIGASLLGALVATRLANLRFHRVLGVGIVVLLAVQSNLVVTRWRDPETLWRTTTAQFPRSPMAHVELGKVLLRREGQEAEAEQCFRRALDVSPTLEEAQAGLAVAAARRGDCAAALHWLAEAQRRNPSVSGASILPCR